MATDDNSDKTPAARLLNWFYEDGRRARGELGDGGAERRARRARRRSNRPWLVAPCRSGHVRQYRAPDRINFTVIGPAVNFAARLERLTNTLGETLVMSAEFAATRPMPKRALGRHALRGLVEPVAVFGVPEELAVI